MFSNIFCSSYLEKKDQLNSNKHKNKLDVSTREATNDTISTNSYHVKIQLLLNIYLLPSKRNGGLSEKKAPLNNTKTNNEIQNYSKFKIQNYRYANHDRLM